jgi:hypothetical protein
VVGKDRRLAVLLLLAAACDAAGAAPAHDPPRVTSVDDLAVVLVDDLVVVRADGPPPRRRLEPPLSLFALRDEVVAFQVVVSAEGAPLAGVTVDVTLPPPLAVERFVEHYLPVTVRSRGRWGRESLGWTAEARPPDADALGLVPDPLVPVAHAPAWRPYPLAVPAARHAAVWVDVTVPADTPPGPYQGSVEVRAEGRPPWRVPVVVTVADARLPYRAAPVLAYYERDTLEERIGGDAGAVERQVWQVLHAHGVDALADLRGVDDVSRLGGAFDGTWFTPAAGYAGPGAGVPVSAAAIGAYGSLGPPTAEALRTVEVVAAAVPAELGLFLYAVDETCDSPLGPAWRRALAGSRAAGRVLAAHTCHADPRRQDVDLVMMPAERFGGDAAAGARARGQRVWVYNGRLPRAPSLFLDEPAGAAAALGWMAAAHDVDHWFLWETVFWNDGNRGGLGPVDVWENPETYHNADGDACLGAGVLLYPGDERGAFAAHALGVAGVVPSMRLKRLRRGLQDAGYLALAHRAAPRQSAAILARALPMAMGEHPEDLAPVWDTSGATFAAAREELRALIPPGAALSPADAAAELRALAETRRLLRAHAGSAPLAVVIILVGLAFVAVAAAYRRSRPK